MYNLLEVMGACMICVIGILSEDLCLNCKLPQVDNVMWIQKGSVGKYKCTCSGVVCVSFNLYLTVCFLLQASGSNNPHHR